MQSDWVHIEVYNFKSVDHVIVWKNKNKIWIDKIFI